MYCCWCGYISVVAVASPTATAAAVASTAATAEAATAAAPAWASAAALASAAAATKIIHQPEQALAAASVVPGCKQTKIKTIRFVDGNWNAGRRFPGDRTPSRGQATRVGLYFDTSVCVRC